MKNKLLSLLPGLALCACALQPPAPPPAPPAPEPAAVAEPEAPPAPADEIAPMLAYQQALRRMGPAELARELHSQTAQPKGARQAMRVALVLMQNRTDLVRAQALLDNLAGAPGPEAQALGPLARLLAAHCTELRRIGEHNDKLAAQLKDSQRRNEQLSEMLEALKAIERTLPARPGAGVVASPGVGK